MNSMALLFLPCVPYFPSGQPGLPMSPRSPSRSDQPVLQNTNNSALAEGTAPLGGCLLRASPSTSTALLTHSWCSVDLAHVTE